MNRYIVGIILFLVFSSPFAETLELKAARVNEAPPGAQVMAGYMTIVNNSDQRRSIISVTSPDYETVEMHHSYIEDGVAKMKKISALTVAPEQTLKLAPGGNHLMLIKPKKQFRQGEMIVLNLTEKDGTEHRLVITVTKHESSHHHHQHD